MKKNTVSEPIEQVIESTHANKSISMKVKVTNGSLVSMSFSKTQSGRHLFSLRRLDNGRMLKASEYLLDVMQICREARDILSDFRRMSKD